MKIYCVVVDKTLIHVIMHIYIPKEAENVFLTHLGVWVLVCGGIGHMVNEIAHFSCCYSPLPDLPPTHPSFCPVMECIFANLFSDGCNQRVGCIIFLFFFFPLRLVHCLVYSFGLIAFCMCGLIKVRLHCSAWHGYQLCVRRKN